jgi:hypothetical protein
MSVKVKRVVVWRTVVENRPGEMARALESLAWLDLSLVIGYQGAVIDVAPVVGKKAMAAAKHAGFKPLPTPMILVEGVNRPGICHAVARALGEAGISMDAVVAQTAGATYQALVGLAADADLNKAMRQIKKALTKLVIDKRGAR